MLPHWLIKLGFHLLYYQLAWTYDLVAWLVSFGQWAAWRRLALAYLQPGPTLELAYGTGAFFLEMQQAGHQPVGVDLSPYMARLAGMRLRRFHLPPTLSRGKAQALPFPTGQFTNVVATFPTDYLLHPATLAEVYRVLHSSGRLIVVFEGQLRGPWPLRSWLNWLYRLTNQRSLPPAKPIAFAQSMGFEAHWESTTQAGATAHLLIAHPKK